MRPACFLARRRFAFYLEGLVRPGQAERLERHLRECPSCPELLSRLKAGHEAGRSFGRLAPAAAPGRLPSFDEIRAGRPGSRAWSPALAAPALLAAAAVLVAVFAVTGRHLAVRTTPAGTFAPLAIRDFATGTRKQVVTEGYVQDVYHDEQEQTLHIKLGETAHRTGPFVICEVRDARGLTIPAAGSRVRVYGRARFDAQPGRNWPEVNPVMEIAVLNR